MPGDLDRTSGLSIALWERTVTMRHRTVVAFVVAIGVALALLALRARCEGRRFLWLSAACETSDRPIILQRDLHRV